MMVNLHKIFLGNSNKSEQAMHQPTQMNTISNRTNQVQIQQIPTINIKTSNSADQHRVKMTAFLLVTTMRQLNPQQLLLSVRNISNTIGVVKSQTMSQELILRYGRIYKNIKGDCLYYSNNSYLWLRFTKYSQKKISFINLLLLIFKMNYSLRIENEIIYNEFEDEYTIKMQSMLEYLHLK